MKLFLGQTDGEIGYYCCARVQTSDHFVLNVSLLLMSFYLLPSGKNTDTTMAASDALRRVIVFDMCTNEVFSGVREVNPALVKDCKLPDNPGWLDFL